jgi:CarD family transcriptional regulator
MDFKIGDQVVYPAHGVGTINGIETQNIGGTEMQVFVIALKKDNMTLRVPTKRALTVGLRAVSSKEYLEEVIKALKSKPKTTKGMWSKRAQEYETKINSGDIVSVAEVVRDLHKNVTDPERSYSERIIYESALNRLSGEFAAIENVSTETAVEKIINLIIQKESAA